MIIKQIIHDVSKEYEFPLDRAKLLFDSIMQLLGIPVSNDVVIGFENEVERGP